MGKNVFQLGKYRVEIGKRGPKIREEATKNQVHRTEGSIKLWVNPQTKRFDDTRS